MDDNFFTYKIVDKQDNILMLEKNKKRFKAYILNKDENNTYISELAPKLCNIQYDNLMKCEFIEDKNKYYFITKDYETSTDIRSYFSCFLPISSYIKENLLKILDLFIELEKLGLNGCLPDKIIDSNGKLLLDYLCSFFFGDKDCKSNIEVFKTIYKRYFPAFKNDNLDNFDDLISIKEHLLNSLVKNISKYEINLFPSAIKNYKEFIDTENIKNEFELRLELNKYINANNAYFLLENNKNNEKTIYIALRDYVFLCSEKKSKRRFECFAIHCDNEILLDKIYKNGLFKDNIEFLLEVNNKNNNFDCKSIDELLKEIKQHSSSDDNAILYSEKSIKMEEDLLKAENDYIQSKKLSQIGTISNTKNNQLCFVIENANRHFKQNHKVIIKKLNYTQDDDELKGVVDKFVSTKSLLYVNIEDEYSKINLKQYDKNEILIKYSINYDYQAEEIVFKKKERALDELKKSNVYINNLASKLCEPNLNFTENNLIKIDEFFNKNLDENQQLAVKKALSLQDGSEILLIQGPPGTGKTTTIVEIIKQYLKLHPSYKMLITSQSNQAVDNVLEKICEEEQKILRIGNDESKMSEIARKYTPNKIINTIVSKNIKDLQENEIQKFKKNQDEFKEILQSITSKSVKNTDVEMFFIKNIKIIFGTLIGISSWNNFREIVFDLVIVDEAGRATLSELLVPCIKAKKIIFVGDHKQLAPIIDDDIANNLESYSKKEVITSLFEQLFNSNTKFNNLKHMLTYNYRAHKSICNIYSNVFYEGDLKTKDEINELKQHNIDCYIANLVWLNTGNLKDRADEQKGTGKINRCNAKIIKQELNTLQNYCKNNNLSIGIITPYKDQKYYLDNYLKDIVQKYKQDDIQIDIGTVDSFQGSDRDIIFYDCVRAGGGKKSKIDFIADEKRLNVSLSRAKKLLLIVGDIDFLYKSCTNNGFNPFKEIIEYIYKNKSEYEVRNLGEVNEA